MSERTEIQSGHEVAIVGVAGRFPGALDARGLWRNLRQSVESIERVDDADLERVGVPRALALDPRYVKASSDLDGIELFDPEFFGLPALEAAVIDPQQRLLLELAWEAFEDACHPPSTFPGAIGVFVGASRNDYLERVLADPSHLARLGAFALEIGNSRDFLATRLSYHFDLRGPSITVQTACSTSLVAVHQACQSLLAGECDMALAGGVSIRLPQRAGYLWTEGSVASPDGHCRAFDARARGTVAGNGGALVLLRRLDEALADGDHVYAVIRGTAVNNDGASKVGFTAPSVRGQAAVIEEALAIAEVEPATIGYVEAHGTGTPLGDPIEIAALAQAFAGAGLAPGSCAIGSIKTNLGHLDAAAGIAGLVKATLAVHHGEIPPSLHFERANPEIGLERTPFRVQTQLSAWKSSGPRRAGVSSFGIGGTNAHAILEQAPAELAATNEQSTQATPAGLGPASARSPSLVVLSARSTAALERAAIQLAERLETEPDLDLADVAWSLQVGRRAFSHRAALVGRDTPEIARDLRESRWVANSSAGARRAAFLFPGQGTQRAGMALELHASDPIVRAELDHCAEILRAHDLDLLALLAAAGTTLDATHFAQPALFAVEYALARRWISLGIEPAAMLGHSIGELVAACLAGVFPLETALRLAVERGRIMQAMPPGAMLYTALSEQELERRLSPSLAIASVNGPRACVASGPIEAIDALERDLARDGIAHKRLATSHAFHSPMMETAAVRFGEVVSSVELSPPVKRYLSNVTGRWIESREATDPRYWAGQLRRTVRLADGISELLRDGQHVLIEIGPGRTFGPLVRDLGDLAARQPGRSTGRLLGSSPTRERKETELPISTLPRRAGEDDEPFFLLEAVGRAWTRGVEIDWRALDSDARHKRVSLPTYPFERRYLWVDRIETKAATGSEPSKPPRSAGQSEPSKPPRRPGESETSQPSHDPTESTSAAIARIFSESLGLETFAPDDDFFELGGSSLLAIQVLARLREEFGVELALADLLDATTPASLASRLAGGREPTTNAPLLFCVHGVDGESAVFTSLARALRPVRALVPLRAAGLEPGETPCASVEELAERYLALLRARQPHGPYSLAGYSFGGLVAFEIARKLRAQGEQVERLALFDSRLVGGEPEPGEAELEELAFARLRATGMIPPVAHATDESVRRRIAVFVAHARAAFRYRPDPAPGDAQLFLAGDEDQALQREIAARWRTLAGDGLAVHVLPGDHDSILAGSRAAGVATVLGLSNRARIEDDQRPAEGTRA